MCVCNNVNINLKNGTYKGHLGSDSIPENLLLSNDKYYASQTGVNSNDWIIFQNKGNQKYSPTKIDIRGRDHSDSIKEFNFWIGESDTNEWIKLNQKPFRAQNKEGMQSFPFEICENNNMNNAINQKWKQIQKNDFVQYKLQILNNYGYHWNISFYEFKLFGVKYD